MRFQVLAIAVDVLGQHRHQRRRHGQQDGRMRPGHAQHRRVRVRRLHAVDWRQHGLERMVLLDRHDRERHVLGRHRLAVMEQRILAQMQRQRARIGRQLPGFGQIRLRLPVRVKAQRAGEELRAGQRRGDAGLHRAVQVARHLRRADHQRAARLGRFRRAGRAERERGEQTSQDMSCAAHVASPLESWSIGRFVHADGLGSSVATRRSRA